MSSLVNICSNPKKGYLCFWATWKGQKYKVESYLDMKFVERVFRKPTKAEKKKLDNDDKFENVWTVVLTQGGRSKFYDLSRENKEVEEVLTIAREIQYSHGYMAQEVCDVADYAFEIDEKIYDEIINLADTFEYKKCETNEAISKYKQTHRLANLESDEE